MIIKLLDNNIVTGKKNVCIYFLYVYFVRQYITKWRCPITPEGLTLSKNNTHTLIIYHSEVHVLQNNNAKLISSPNVYNLQTEVKCLLGTMKVMY